MDELLTDDEKRALELTGELENLFGRIVGNGSSRSFDLNEVCGHIHVLQHMLMAQAAARRYPTEYRLLGRTLSD